MRAMILMLAAGVGVAAAGCTERDAATPAPTATATVAADTAASAANTTAAAGFKPPSSMSRLDYGSRAERRFQKLDTNQDNKLSASELPSKRGTRMMKRADTNSDGMIDGTEWSTAMLARFDKEDANKDGTLTSEERGERGGKKGKRAGKNDPMMDEGDEVDNGF